MACKFPAQYENGYKSCYEAEFPAWLYVVGDRWIGSFKELTGGIWR